MFAIVLAAIVSMFLAVFTIPSRVGVKLAYVLFAVAEMVLLYAFRAEGPHWLFVVYCTIGLVLYLLQLAYFGSAVYVSSGSDRRWACFLGIFALAGTIMSGYLLFVPQIG